MSRLHDTIITTANQNNGKHAVKDVVIVHRGYIDK